MDFNTILGLSSVVIIVIAFAIMLIVYKQLTKGLWKKYILWLTVSGVLMSIYLLSFVMAKMGFYPQYYHYVLLFGFLAESIAALTYIKSSEVLRTMADRFGFAHKPIHKTLKLGEEKIKKIIS